MIMPGRLKSAGNPFDSDRGPVAPGHGTQGIHRGQRVRGALGEQFAGFVRDRNHGTCQVHRNSAAAFH